MSINMGIIERKEGTKDVPTWHLIFVFGKQEARKQLTQSDVSSGPLRTRCACVLPKLGKKQRNN